MGSIPYAPEQITAQWLSEAIGSEITSFDVEQIGIGIGLLGRLYRISFSGPNGFSGSAVAKFPTLDEGARANVVAPMRFYEKEVRAYQEVTDASPIGTPRVYAAHFDEGSGDFCLLIEDLSDRRMEDQNVGCENDDAYEAVGALVGLHTHWWSHDDLEELQWLPTVAQAPFPQVIAGMFQQAWPKAEEVLSRRLGDTFRDYGQRFPKLVQWFCDEITEEPMTLCHGDYRLDNLFFGTDDRPVTAVDWQLCFRGRGGYDLAYFVSQSLTTECRRDIEDVLIQRYDALLASRGIDYPMDELRDDYRRTVAFCFCYPIISAGQIEVTNERHVALLDQMTDRAIKAIEDNRALDILP